MYRNNNIFLLRGLIAIDKTKKLVVLSADYKVAEDLSMYLRKIFKDTVSIYSFCLKDNLEPMNNYDVVLTSHKVLNEKAKLLFPNSTIVEGEKTLNGYNLEKILQLPKGKKVLVLNTPKTISEEVIESLIDIGINHIEYIPFDPYVDHMEEAYLDIDTAISPGLNHLAPMNIMNIIDIGCRIINISTFFKLLKALDLDYNYLNIYNEQYFNLLMQTATKLAKSLDKSEQLLEKQKIIINQVDDGIILVDKNGIIDNTNYGIEKIFDLKKNLIGIPISEFLSKIGLTSNIINNRIENVIINYKDKKIVCNEVDIGHDDIAGYYVFKEVDKVVELEIEIRRKLYKKGYLAKYNFNDIICNNPRMNQAKEKALDFAKTNLSILLVGESGTGKELFAQAIHNNSLKKNGPFIAINFAALPENLVESELFGYEKGSFTGANKSGKPGLFEQAHGGTMFLDEIGDASLNIQAKLLRVLQEKEIMRIGGENIIPIDVRIISATNKDLVNEVHNGKFRRDLYYRLNTLPIEIPALRNRKEDIFLLLNKYLNKEYNITKEFSKEVNKFLYNYNWPGNVRELQNIADYVYYSSRGREKIELNDLPTYIFKLTENRNQFINNVNNDNNDNNVDTVDTVESNIDMEILKDKNYIMIVLGGFINLGYEGIGRNKLLNLINENEHRITEYKLIKVLKKLNDLGFIIIGNTKQGSSITQKGIEYYKTFENLC